MSSPLANGPSSRRVFALTQVEGKGGLWLCWHSYDDLPEQIEQTENAQQGLHTLLHTHIPRGWSMICPHAELSESSESELQTVPVPSPSPTLVAERLLLLVLHIVYPPTGPFALQSPCGARRVSHHWHISHSWAWPTWTFSHVLPLIWLAYSGWG